MGHVTWITMIFGSIPEAFCILLIAETIIGVKKDFKELTLMSVISSIFCYIILNYLNIPFGIHSLLIVLTYSAILKVLKKINIIDSIVGVVFGWMISALTQYINLIVIYLLGLNYNYLSKNEILKMIYFYPSVILFIIFTIIIHKKNIKIYNREITKNSNKLKKNNNLFILVSFLVNSVIIVLFNIYLSVYRNDKWDLEKRFTVFIIIALMISVFFMILIILRFFRDKLKKDYENILIDKSLEDMKKNIKTLKKQRHDYLRHMQIIYSLMDVNKHNNAKEYIESLTEHINNEGIYVDTGNIYINSVISLKQEQSKHRKIDFNVSVKSKIDDIKIPNFEMCNIVSNIIDNAFDALDEIEMDNKFVEMMIYGDELCYIFRIKNNGNKIKNIAQIFDEGFSTKKGINRGFGLYIVKQTLEKYSSSIFVESEESITEFSIVIPKY